MSEESGNEGVIAVLRRKKILKSGIPWKNVRLPWKKCLPLQKVLKIR
jgi:hypothetical protein